MLSIVRSASICILLPAITYLLAVGTLGCGEKSGRSYKSGQLWMVNNLCALPGQDYRWLKVTWEGEEIDIPNNMDLDGKSTEVGAVQITTDPLPGGTPVDFTLRYQFDLEMKITTLSRMLDSEHEAIIDGGITVDVYSRKWDPNMYRIDAAASVIPGRSNDIHHYPDL